MIELIHDLPPLAVDLSSWNCGKLTDPCQHSLQKLAVNISSRLKSAHSSPNHCHLFLMVISSMICVLEDQLNQNSIKRHLSHASFFKIVF